MTNATIYIPTESITITDASTRIYDSVDFETNNLDYVKVETVRGDEATLLVKDTDYTITALDTGYKFRVRITLTNAPVLNDELRLTMNAPLSAAVDFLSPDVARIDFDKMQKSVEQAAAQTATVASTIDGKVAEGDNELREYVNDELSDVDKELAGLREKDKEQDEIINAPGTLFVPGKVDITQKTFFHDPKRSAGVVGIPMYRVIDILKGPASADKTLYTTRQSGTFVSEADYMPLTTEDIAVSGETHEALVVSFPGNILEYTYLYVEYNDSDVQLPKTAQIPIKTIANGFDWVLSDARAQENDFKRELRVRIAYDETTNISQVKFHKEAVPGSRDASTAVYIFIAYLIKETAKALLAEPNHFVRTVRKEGVSISDKDYYVENETEIVQTDEFYIVNPTASELGDIDDSHAGKFAIKDDKGVITYKAPVNGDTAVVYADRQVDITDGDGNVSRNDENRLVAVLIYEGRWIITNSYFKNANDCNETGGFANAEGSGNTASGNSSHAEGANNTVSGIASHAEGASNTVSGWNAHAEGRGNNVSGLYGHAEGQFNDVNGESAHAEGNNNSADGRNSHAEGSGNTVKIKDAHIQGRNAAIAEANTLFGIGNGSRLPTDDELNGSVDVGLVYKVDGDGNSTQTGKVVAADFEKADGTNIGDLSAYSTTAEIDTKDDEHLTEANTYTNAEINKVKNLIDNIQTGLTGHSIDADGNLILNFADGTSETINLSTLLSDEIAAIELRLDAIEAKNRAQDTKFSEYYTKTESDANDAATLTSAAEARALFTFDKGTINTKDTATLQAAKDYTDNHEGVGGDGKFVDSVVVNNGKIKLGYSDDSTGIESRQFLPSPANQPHARVMVTAARNAQSEINLTATTSADVTETINSLSASAPANEKIHAQALRDGTVSEAKLAAAVQVKLNEGGSVNHSVKVVRKEGTSVGDKDYYVENTAEIVQDDEFYIVNPTASELGTIADAEAGKYAIKNGSTITYTAPEDGDMAFIYADRQVDITDGDGNVTTANENKIVATLVHEGGKWIITNSGFKTGNGNTETGAFANAEGSGTTASGGNSHAEGLASIASGDAAHAEGWSATASGADSHAEGRYNTASGNSSHAEGQGTTASGDVSHAQGLGTTAKTPVSTILGSNGVVAEPTTVVGIAQGSTAPSAAQKTGSVDVGLVWKADQSGNTTQTGKVVASSFELTNGEVLKSGGEKAIESLAADREWKAEVQTYDNASAPDSPATIGIAYNTQNFDFIFPTATNKAAVDALVVGRKFAFELSNEHVVVATISEYVSSAVIGSTHHRERYTATFILFPGAASTSNTNNNYQTTLYRGVVSATKSTNLTDMPQELGRDNAHKILQVNAAGDAYELTDAEDGGSSAPESRTRVFANSAIVGTGSSSTGWRFASGNSLLLPVGNAQETPNVIASTESYRGISIDIPKIRWNAMDKILITASHANQVVAGTVMPFYKADMVAGTRYTVGISGSGRVKMQMYFEEGKNQLGQADPNSNRLVIEMTEGGSTGWYIGEVVFINNTGGSTGGDSGGSVVWVPETYKDIFINSGYNVVNGNWAYLIEGLALGYSYQSVGVVRPTLTSHAHYAEQYRIAISHDDYDNMDKIKIMNAFDGMDLQLNDRFDISFYLGEFDDVYKSDIDDGSVFVVADTVGNNNSSLAISVVKNVDERGAASTTTHQLRVAAIPKGTGGNFQPNTSAYNIAKVKFITLGHIQA